MLGARLQMGFGGCFIRKYLAIINSFIHFIETESSDPDIVPGLGTMPISSPITMTAETQRSGDHKARKGGGKIEAW